MDDKTIKINGMSEVIIEQIRHNQELKEQNRLLSSAPSGISSADAARKIRIAQAEARTFNLQLEEARKALAEKDATLKEWKHSHEVHRRMQRKYGKMLGMTDDQRTKDYDDFVLEIAEEKPEFADTNVLKEVKEARGIK